MVPAIESQNLGQRCRIDTAVFRRRNLRSFEQPQPAVQVEDGEISVRYPRMGVFDWGKTAARVALNSRIPWTILLRGGARDVAIEASRMDLASLSIEGGADKIELDLPLPSGSVPVRIEGGLNRVHIRRPSGAGIELQVRGGANRIQFDGQQFGAIGGDVRLASDTWESDRYRYAVEVSGGASRLEVNQI